MVSEVIDGSPAMKAGVQPGDLLLTFDTHEPRVAWTIFTVS
jgi:C-terminal processing protease CtpA/Prc